MTTVVLTGKSKFMRKFPGSGISRLAAYLAIGKFFPLLVIGVVLCVVAMCIIADTRNEQAIARGERFRHVPLLQKGRK